MRRFYGWKHMLVLPEDLQAFAWSAPMRDLAANLEISDTGLKKLLASHGIYPPPQGYWNKLKAGKPVPKPPRLRPRGPGETGRLSLDERFQDIVPAAKPWPSEGPFATPLVPEDLDELHAQELQAIGKVGVRKDLDRVHAGLARLLNQEKRRGEKFASSGWDWDKPKFESPLDKRRLRILNAILLTLSRCGRGGGEVYERDEQLQAAATVGDTSVGLELEPIASPRQVRPTFGVAPSLPAKTPLVLRIKTSSGHHGEHEWREDESGTLETKVARIAASIIVEGEAKFRRSLLEAEERAEQFRAYEEKRRQEELARRNRERLEKLHESGELLRQAEDIRALVARLRQAMTDGVVELDEATLRAWEEWALAEADRIDPIRSGQVNTHLRP
jgi:hypothetical protein